jgi:hypothetical protein
MRSLKIPDFLDSQHQYLKARRNFNPFYVLITYPSTSLTCYLNEILIKLLCFWTLFIVLFLFKIQHFRVGAGISQSV